MTFRELRKQKNTAVKELKAAVQFLKQKREENTRLKDVIDMQQKTISRLKDSLEDSIEYKRRIINRLHFAKKCRDKFYSRWLKAQSKISNWKKLCSFITIVSAITILALAIN